MVYSSFRAVAQYFPLNVILKPFHIRNNFNFEVNMFVRCSNSGRLGTPGHEPAA